MFFKYKLIYNNRYGTQKTKYFRNEKSLNNFLRLNDSSIIRITKRIKK